MNKSIIIFITFVLSLLVQPTFAGFNQALDAYAKKDYPKAFKEFEALAKIGETRSQLNLGAMYFYGQGVTKNINLAYAWIRLGVENDLENMDSKGKLRAIKQHVTDMAAALKTYHQLANQYSYQVLYQKLYPEILKSNQDQVNQSASLPPLTPIKIKPAKYPKKALLSGLTGWVTTQFNLDPTGKPRDIKVIQEVPKKIFHSSAIRAIKKWRFKPIVNKSGKAIWRYDARYTLDYMIKGENPYNTVYFNNAFKKAKTGDPIAQVRYAFLKQNVRDYNYPDNKTPTEWYLSPAIKGVPYAQYALGSNLVYGLGCKKDKSKGIQWLTRSAANGVDEASQLLAKLSLRTASKQAQQTAIKFFKESKKKNPTNSVEFAWIFATSKFKNLRNPDLAIELVDNLSCHQYNDEITIQEILAAAFAAKGNFKKAISYQEDALDDAKDDDYYTGDIKQHLQVYKQHKTWF